MRSVRVVGRPTFFFYIYFYLVIDRTKTISTHFSTPNMQNTKKKKTMRARARSTERYPVTHPRCGLSIHT